MFRGALARLDTQTILAGLWVGDISGTVIVPCLVVIENEVRLEKHAF